MAEITPDSTGEQHPTANPPMAGRAADWPRSNATTGVIRQKPRRRARSNRDIAATLYLSPKTIEWHLGHIYGKLGITGRTRLAMAIARSNARQFATAQLS